MSDERLDLFAAQLERLKREHVAFIEREMYRDICPLPVKPLTWLERMDLRWSRVREYFVVLWRALKGWEPPQ